MRAAERRDDGARLMERVRVVVGEVVGDAREARVDVAAAELLGGHVLAGRRLHERRPAEEDRAGLLHDDRLVAHRRHVGAAGRARAHHHRNLGDALRRQARLVEEDAAEVLAIGEDLGLQRQEGAARVDEVDAGQPVVERDLLGAQVLLDRQRVVGAALHRRIVGDDHHLAAGDAADAGDQPGARARRRRRDRWRRAARSRGRAIRDRAARRCARGPAACLARDGGRAPRARRRRGPPRAARAGRRRGPSCAPRCRGTRR